MLIENEVRLEGERRGCDVSPEDPVVREHVCEIILRIGRDLRKNVMAPIAARHHQARASG